MNHRRLLFSAALVVVLGLLYVHVGAEEASAPVEPGRFTGKVAVVYLQNMLVEDGILVRDARFEQVRGRWFLTGQSPDVGDPEDWMSGSEIWVEWARVESFHVLSEEHFQKHFLIKDKEDVKAT